MSFQEFQKAPNRLTPRDIGFLIFTGITIVLVLYGLWIANSYLVALVPDGGEFYLLRTGGRSFLFDQVEPYSGAVPARVQEQVYERPANMGEDLYILDIPFHLLIFFFPLALVPDSLMARTLWMVVSEIALAGFLFYCFRLLNRRIPVFFLILISLAGFSSFYAYQSLLEGSPAIILSLTYVSILIAIYAGLDELAGALITLSAFQWEMGGLLLVFVVLWCFWERRWRVFIGLGMLAFVLLAFSFLWYPGWLLPFLQAAWNSLQSGFGYSVRSIVGQLWPQNASLIGWTLTAILIVSLGYEWLAARKANNNRFIWAASLTLAATPLLGFRLEMDQLLPLTLPVLLVIVISRERWHKLGNGIAVILTLFYFCVPWLIYTQGLPQGIDLQANEALFLFWPIFNVIGLYWIRWWMIRPPRTWLDSFPHKDRL